MRPITICLINQKGGCGKSSTCFHLAGHFAQTGQRVLLIDADPQGSLSQGFFGSSFVECLEPQETLAALFQDQSFPAGGLSGYARRCKTSRFCVPTSTWPSTTRRVRNQPA